jgi:hypothetical protein
VDPAPRGAPHLFRTGQLPPLRGASVQLDERSLLLYTRGVNTESPDLPGHVRATAAPHPPGTDGTDLRSAAIDALARSKMNWKNARSSTNVTRLLCPPQAGWGPFSSTFVKTRRSQPASPTACERARPSTQRGGHHGGSFSGVLEREAVYPDRRFWNLRRVRSSTTCLAGEMTHRQSSSVPAGSART